ncbi:MAG: DUF4388 domain-containing protein [Chitinivibrionales bacterium]|nr:DUF4388 domain-containing protein [Chitinivibrionales bacterium]
MKPEASCFTGLLLVITFTLSAQQTAPPKTISGQRADSSAVSPEDTAQYITISQGPAPVLKSLAPNSPILGMAQQGKIFRLINRGKSWHRIAFKDTIGWIEKRYTKSVVNNRFSSLTRNLPAYGIGALFGGGLIFLLVLAAIFLGGRILIAGLKKRSSVNVPAGKGCLIIARETKKIEYSLSSRVAALETCFTEIGFEVTNAHELNVARNILWHYNPDVICVDWQLEDNIHKKVGNLLLGKASTANIFVIFYNVPDPASVQQNSGIPNVSYLGISFTDRDIFKFVTPLIMTDRKSKEVRRSVESHALEGDISNGSLSEVFQFLEIGKKSGCMLIDKNGPYGMIYFEQGQITSASTPSQKGNDAVYSMLNIPEGTFRFLLGKSSQARNVTIGTLGLLMEWARLNDEASRH